MRQVVLLSRTLHRRTSKRLDAHPLLNKLGGEILHGILEFVEYSHGDCIAFTIDQLNVVHDGRTILFRIGLSRRSLTTTLRRKAQLDSRHDFVGVMVMTMVVMVVMAYVVAAA